MTESQTDKPQAPQKSDSGVHVALHPLVLLTISDYITRHTLRQLKGPVLGALLGQQNGREITVEHAFECKMSKDNLSAPDMQWFDVRLTHMKEVHKAPVLDLVGWYTLVPQSGPQSFHEEIQANLSDVYSESTLLLGFHTSAVLEKSVGGKLPLTIYEAEVKPPEVNMSEDVEMTDDLTTSRVTFKELPFSVETGEAEMIAVDFVARGGGNAMAVPTAKPIEPKTPEISSPRSVDKSPAKSETSKAAKAASQNILSREDEELIASLTAKVNATKVLQSRIDLLTTYLQKLPQPSTSSSGTDLDGATYDHSIIRSIQALVNRLPLLVPSDSTSFQSELLSEETDVHLVSLLSTLTESLHDATELGRKFHITEMGRKMDNNQRKMIWDTDAMDSVASTGVGSSMMGGDLITPKER